MAKNPGRRSERIPKSFTKHIAVSSKPSGGATPTLNPPHMGEEDRCVDEAAERPGCERRTLWCRYNGKAGHRMLMQASCMLAQAHRKRTSAKPARERIECMIRVIFRHAVIETPANRPVDSDSRV